MDNTPRPFRLAAALRTGWRLGWNSEPSLGRRRLLGLLVAFHGYCAAFLCLISLVAVAARRNVAANLAGAAITAVIAFGVITIGRAIRRSAA